jgi:transcriptional regulator EpsA
MSFLSNISVSELPPLLNLVRECSVIRRHYELFSWLQNQVQRFIPHDILITAWGDFSLGLVRHDIVSPLAGMRTDTFDDKDILPFLNTLFDRWEACDHLPYMIRSEDGFYHKQIASPVFNDTIAQMRCGLIHGIKDKRGHHDCLYVFLGPQDLGSVRARDALRFLLPYIDTAFRQITLLPEQRHKEAEEVLKETVTSALSSASSVYGDSMATELSGREAEIMHWVRMGKTNQEIGQILDISSFTVKNHLQRIFKKLNVSNRAQAVSKL